MLAPIPTAVPPEMENHETHEARETPAPEGAGVYRTPPAAAAIAMADPVTTNPPLAAPEEDLNAEGAEADAEGAEDGSRPEVVCHSFREGEEIAGAAGTCRAGSRVFSFTVTRTLREGAWRLRVEEGAMPATQRAAEAVATVGAEIRPLAADALLYGSAHDALATARAIVAGLAARRLAKTLAARRKRANRKARKEETSR